MKCGATIQGYGTEAQVWQCYQDRLPMTGVDMTVIVAVALLILLLGTFVQIWTRKPNT